MTVMNRRKFLTALGLTGAAYTLGGLPRGLADTAQPKRHHRLHRPRHRLRYVEDASLRARSEY